jgi:hypothetical protein
MATERYQHKIEQEAITIKKGRTAASLKQQLLHLMMTN